MLLQHIGEAFKILMNSDYNSIYTILLCSQLLSHVQLFAVPWTVAPVSMGLSKQEYWSGFTLPHPGIEPTFPVAPANSSVDSLPLSHPGSLLYHYMEYIFNLRS